MRSDPLRVQPAARRDAQLLASTASSSGATFASGIVVAVSARKSLALQRAHRAWRHGGETTRSFCAECGTPLFPVVKRCRLMSSRFPTLDETPVQAMTGHMDFELAAVTCLSGEIPQFPRSP